MVDHSPVEPADDYVTGIGLQRIDHVGVAVADLDAAIALHRDTYGMPLVHRETIAEQGVEAALLDVGNSHVELLAPLGDDTPVGRFLAKRGPGMHHVAYLVDDIDAALADARAAGAELIDERPRSGLFGLRVAFVHPDGVDGVLVEFVQESENGAAHE
jgi:methylmalonyl-CoA/ethylmalonyl-CoA epimerase